VEGAAITGAGDPPVMGVWKVRPAVCGGVAVGTAGLIRDPGEEAGFGIVLGAVTGVDGAATGALGAATWEKV
jgi:hypothetical protein